MRHVSDTERRARLALRHALTPATAAEGPEAATRAVAVLHSTEPATVYLSCWARVPGLRVDDVDRALHVDRTLVKQLAMRRTLFVFPRDLLPAAWGSAAARTAATEGARLAKDAVLAGLREDGAAWLAQARAEVLDLLAAHPEGLAATEVRQAVPLIDVRLSGGTVWAAPRVLTHLGATGDVVRTVNGGHWRVSRPRWGLMSTWLGDVPAPLPPDDGYRELVTRWLHRFGPGTEDDLVWWLGATRGIVRRALADVGAVAVSLDGGGTGWLLPDDLEAVELGAPGPWVALLPVLDPTVMGWKQRDWYLGPHGPALFDRNGNAGTTAWVDGRAVGCWVQDDAGRVHVHLLEEVPAAAADALRARAEQLTDWLAGVRVGTVYPSPAMKVARDALLVRADPAPGPPRSPRLT